MEKSGAGAWWPYGEKAEELANAVLAYDKLLDLRNCLLPEELKGSDIVNRCAVSRHEVFTLASGIKTLSGERFQYDIIVRKLDTAVTEKRWTDVDRILSVMEQFGPIVACDLPYYQTYVLFTREN